MPVTNYTHAQILEILKPYASRGWIKRFIQVEAQGTDRWLMVVRDFNIQAPEVEYLVEDIVRALEPPPQEKSLVRAEMEQLEAKGKLDLSTPEKAQEWEDKLEEERQKREEWRKTDAEARARQRKSDLEFLANKMKKDGLVIPNKNQDIVNNPELRARLSGEVESPKKETPQMPQEPQKEDVVVPSTPTPEKPITDKVEHAKELSETEKAQLSFKPKPAPEKEPEYKEPVIKSISTVGDDGAQKEVYKKPEPKSIKTIDGLSEDSLNRLKQHGITTAESFEGMTHEQAKNILGMPVYQSIKSKLKT